MTATLTTVVPRTAVRFRSHGTHRHDMAHLIHVIRGEATVVADGEPYHLAEGETLWLAAQVPHSLTGHDDTITFGPMVGPAAAPPERVVRLGRQAELAQLLLTAMSAAPQTDEEIRPFRHSIEQLLLDLRERPWPLTAPTQPAARRIALRLIAGRDLALPLDDLAGHEFTSVRQVQRAFVDETGLTFSTWRTRARLNAAARSLRAGVGFGRAAVTAGYATRDGLLRAIVRETRLPASQVQADPVAALRATTGDTPGGSA